MKMQSYIRLQCLSTAAPRDVLILSSSVRKRRVAAYSGVESSAISNQGKQAVAKAAPGHPTDDNKKNKKRMDMYLVHRGTRKQKGKIIIIIIIKGTSI